MTLVSTTNDQPDDDRYEDFLAAIVSRFELATDSGRLEHAPIFTTNATGLWYAFLGTLPTAKRQHYTCRACQTFVERFGGLVVVDGAGSARSALWDPNTTAPLFQPAVRAIERLVHRAEIDGVFLSEERVLGTAYSTHATKAPGTWRHMSLPQAVQRIYKPTALKTTYQATAEKRDEYGMLCRGLAEFSIDVVRKAHTLLTTGNLYRSERCIGIAKWLLELHEARDRAKGSTARDNVTWVAVAGAPPGFAHVRSTMIGTLLEDVAGGMAFDQIKRRFDEKMNPLQYQRPQAAPSAGNIAQAEKVVAELASAGALARRFAKVEDLETLWKPPAPPKEETTKPAGVFGHLVPKGAAEVSREIDQPPVTMTWEKFRRTIVPEADRIELFVRPALDGYAALVTAANPDAPPILQWDRAEKRNPVSWYLYHGGSAPTAWNLKPSTWCAVTAIALQPSLWGDESKNAHQGASLFLVLEGARDLRHERGGGFFPEQLRSEYHGVRATMEAYARGAAIAGRDEATACGLKLETGRAWEALVRVTSKGTRVSYRLDRWD